MKRLAAQFAVTFLAVGLALAGYEYYNNKNVESFIDHQTQAIQVQQSLMLASPIKAAVAEYYQVFVTWPNSNTALHLPAPSDYRNENLQGLEVSEGGVITLIFNANFAWGEGAIKFTPSINEGTGRISWQCISNTYTTLQSVVSACEYQEGLVAKAPTPEPKPQTLPAIPEPESEPHSCLNSGFVVNPLYSSEIKNRLPHRVITRITPSVSKLIHFSEIVALKGSEVDFHWYQNGSLIKREQIGVETKRWRIWSESGINLALDDELTVEIYNGDCLIFREQHIVQAPLPSDSGEVLLDESPVIFGESYQANLISQQLYLNMHNDRFVLNAPVYFLDTNNNNVRIDARQTRDSHTRDFFTTRVESNSPLTGRINTKGLNRRTFHGDTPLLEAIKAGSKQTFLSLLQYGADPFLRDREGLSPLDLSLRLKRDDFALQLFQKMQDYKNVQSLKSLNALIHNYNQVRGTDNRNRLGETQLMRAAANGNEYALIALTATKSMFGEPIISLFYRDYAQRDALDIAKESGYSGTQFIIEKLLSQLLPPWAVQREIIASAIETNLPSNCDLVSAEQLIWVADLLDVAGRTAEIRWYLGENDAKLLKEEKFIISSNKQRVISQVNTDEFHAGEIYAIRLKLDGIDAKLHSSIQRFSRSKENSQKDCSSSFKPPESFLRHHIQAWTPTGELLKLLPDPIKYVSGHYSSKIHEKIVDTESHNGLAFFLEKGESVHFTSVRKTWMESAISGDRHAIAAQLIGYGFDLKKISDIRGQKYSAIHDAVFNGSMTMIRFLHQQGESVDDPWHDGRIPIVTALENCHLEPIKLLLELGANVDAEFSQRNSPEPISVRNYAQRCFYKTEIRDLFDNLPTK